MQKITGLDLKIQEMAGRIRELREIVNLTTAEMAQKTDVTEEEYITCEEGRSDLNFAGKVLRISTPFQQRRPDRICSAN